MNKKLIAAAIAAAVASPAAMAANDTTLYGQLHVALESRDLADDVQLADHFSRIGIKGSEDLGDGLSAIFKAEFDLNVTEGSGLNASNHRNTYVGLAGGFGTFLVGRHDTPAKVATYAAGNELQGDSLMDLEAQGFSTHRVDDAIAYISPSFSGITVAAAVVPGESGAGGSSSVVGSADGLADGVSVGVIYGGHGVKAGIGYTNVEDLVGASGAVQLDAGASVAFGAAQVGVQYQHQEADGAPDTTVWGIFGKVGMGNNAVMANFIMHDDGSDDETSLAVSAEHKFSKRTKVYVVGRFADDDNDNVSLFEAAASAINSGGRVPAGDDFGVGIVHKF